MASMVALLALTPVSRSWIRFACALSWASAHSGWLVSAATTSSGSDILIFVPMDFPIYLLAESLLPRLETADSLATKSSTAS